MLNERYSIFVNLIDGIYKNMQKLRVETAPDLGIKSVQIFWIYQLSLHPQGLTSAELASKSMISRSLVSREIESLQKSGYIQIQESAKGKRKNYNSRITLTESGKILAASISEKLLQIQNEASKGISLADLSVFYTTLEKLSQNLEAIANKEKNVKGK